MIDAALPYIDHRVQRRTFLRSAALAGGGLLVGFGWPAHAASLVGAAGARPAAIEVGLTAWVRITSDNQVTLVVSQAEIGQGISTTLPAILADELGADWNAVRLQTAPCAPAYANPRYGWMFTGNSESMQAFYDHMRKMGAAARTMLVQAAAARWGVPASECRAEQSAVIHASGKRAAFGDLAQDAAALPVPEQPVLKPASESRVDGKSLPRVDVPAKVDGAAIFGIDFQVPGMFVAAVRTAPTIGGTLRRHDDAKAKAMRGVRAVVPLADGVAVVADTYWRARRALAAVTLDFDPGPNTTIDSARIHREMHDALDRGPFATPVNEGDAAALLAKGARLLSADYDNPFLAHATLEPMNCVAHVTAERCEIWAPTQGQSLAFVALQSVLKLPPENITVNRTPYIGGGFGRRLLPDFVIQAALVSKAAGVPVKVIWDREEDMRRSVLRPATAVRLSAALDTKGMPSALAARVVSPRIITRAAPFLEQQVAKERVDPSAMEGMQHLRYKIHARRVDFHLYETPVPTSVLRTTGYGPNVFALESFIDELAHAAKRDPWQYRRALLAGDERALAVLDRAAAMIGWSKKPAPAKGARIGRGIAFADAFGTLLGMAMDVEVRGTAVKVRRVVAAADCGRVIDPGIAAAGIEGGIVFGLAGCKSEVTLKGGAIEQSNFTTYMLPDMAESPAIEVAFIDGGGALGGVGEVSPVTVAPALANAIFAATGKRLRAMPIGRAGLHFA